MILVKVLGPGERSVEPEMLLSPPVFILLLFWLPFPPGDEGNYTFEWRISSGSCPPKSDTTNIYFKPMPGIPSAADAERCGAGNMVLSASPGINGDAVHWYANASGGAMLLSGNTFTTPVLTADTDYWVASYNSITGCESFRRRIRIIIHPIPAVPVTADYTTLRQYKSDGQCYHWKRR